MVQFEKLHSSCFQESFINRSEMQACIQCKHSTFFCILYLTKNLRSSKDLAQDLNETLFFRWLSTQCVKLSSKCSSNHLVALNVMSNCVWKQIKINQPKSKVILPGSLENYWSRPFWKIAIWLLRLKIIKNWWMTQVFSPVQQFESLSCKTHRSLIDHTVFILDIIVQTFQIFEK